MTYLFWLTIFALLFSFGYLSVLRSFKCFFCIFWVYFCYTFVTLVYFFCFLVLRRILTLGKVLFWLRNWTFFTELRGVNVFRIQIFFSVRTEDVLFISKYNIQFSWCIYQSRIVRETKNWHQNYWKERCNIKKIWLNRWPSRPYEK